MVEMAQSLQTSWPLSAAQQGIWLGQQLHPRSPLYNTAECLEICGLLEPAVFERSLRQMVSEADTLNLRFDIQGDAPIQYLDPSSDWQVQHRDLSGSDNPRQAAWDWMRQDLRQTVNLNADPLFAQALLRIAPGRYLWYQRIHHIAIDGYGAALLVRRVAEIYSALIQGKPLPPSPFGRLQAVLAEDVAYHGSNQQQRDRAYWINALQAAPEPVSLSHSVSPASDFSLRHRHSFHPESFQKLQTVARQMGATWPDLLLAATAVYLHRATGAADLILGLPMMGRLGSAALRVPAMVMNIVPLRVQVRPAGSFAGLVEQIRGQLRAIRPHHRYRYEQLRRDLRRVGGERRLFGPIINIMPFDYPLHFGEAPAIPHNLSAGPVEDLALNIRPRATGRALQIDLEANPACYSLEELAQHQQRWLAELHAALDAPDRAIAPGVDQAETPSSLIQGEPITSPMPGVLNGFLKQAQRRPQAEAVVTGAGSLTYGELLARSQDLGSRLVAAGVQPGQLVAIHLPRSSDAIAAILGVLFSGAAYLALDPAAATGRNASLLYDARPVLIITEADQPLQSIPDLPPQRCLEDLKRFPKAHLPPLPEGDALAYRVYTSGSTGQPKGVMIDHRALACFVSGARQRYGIDAGDRILQFAALHFDTSVEEIFVSLCSGATLVLRQDAMLQSLPQFLSTCQEQQLTVLDLPTAFWHELAFCLSHGQGTLPESLRLVIIGGEAAHPERIRQWHAAVGDAIALLNTYGPSETTVVATAASLEPGCADQGNVPIGRPLPGVAVAVLDAAGYPVPAGQPGELYVLGPTLAQGYWGRPQLSRDRFIHLAQLPGQPRAYRTGDQVFLRQDGQLAFVGRLDNEFKISGHRVDLTEIESALAAIPGIREAAVIGYSLPEGIKRLGAYLVAEPPRPSVQTLRQHLAETLPAAIVPAGFTFVERLPKTASGKIDRTALRDRAPEWLTEHHRTTLSPLEATILDAWQAVLGEQKLTVQDNFFDLGGQSLQTIQVTNWLSTKLGHEIPVSMIFRYPTAAALAQALGSQIQADPARVNQAANPATAAEATAVNSLLAPLLAITEGQPPPLFCVHPAAGLSWCYLGLARHLGTRQPLYGVQSPYLETEMPTTHPLTPESWAQIIETYLALVRHAQPQGPYRLLGWSFGGLIAQAIATRLQQQGEAVERLILLDAYPSHCLQRRNRPTDSEIVALLLQATGQGPTAPSQIPATREALMAQLRQGHLGSQLDQTRLNRVLAITRYNIEMARQAPPPAQYHGDLMFFTAQHHQADAHLTHSAWQPFVNGAIQNYSLNAEHGQILTGDALHTIARAIATDLGRQNVRLNASP